MLDGFEAMSSDALANGVEFNLKRFRNEVSPFALQLPERIEPGSMYVDRYYGLVYDASVLEGRAIYGPASDLPAFGVDRLANAGFLRVPFRRIPRIFVRSHSQFRSILRSFRSADPALQLLYRGQNREYLLTRNAKTLLGLYGDEAALEPSLTPSASRSDILLEEVLPGWIWAVRLFMQRHRSKIRDWASPVTFDEIDRRQRFAELGYTFSLFALALAQHYGLPSAGLDVTTDVDVALFFAMTEFAPPSDGSPFLQATRKSAGSVPGVVYVFAATDRFLLSHQQIRPYGFPNGRPDEQHAHFLHTGWGKSTNECALRLIAAIYLDPSADVGRLPAASALFPHVDRDPFASFLVDLRGKPMPSMKRYLSRLYWVID